MLYVVKETEGEETHGVFQSGKEAAERAKALNEGFRGLGSDRRVRVVREAAPAKGKEEEPTVWIGGWTLPNCAWVSKGADDTAQWVEIPLSGSDWRSREMNRPQRRYDIPWLGEAWWKESTHWAIHFPYPATSNPSRIAFTESEDRGKADRQTVMRPGAYLAKYFGGYLSDNDVQHWALKWANVFAPLDLQFAKTADEIEHVYVNGPNSCMAYCADDFDGSVHPTRAYAGPDLQVAYTCNDSGEITGRAVVWPAENKHGRIYGDTDRMDAALAAAGYAYSNLEGARLTRIESGLGLHVPYLDGCQHVNDDGEYLTITSSGGICADSTSGTVGYQHCCEGCGDSVADGEERCDSHGDTYCDYCFHERYTHCTGCDEYADSDDMRFPEDGNEPLCSTCYADAYDICGSCCGEAASGTLIEGPDRTNRCESCHCDAVTVCDECSDEIMTSDVVGCGLCSDCAESLEEEEPKEEVPDVCGAWVAWQAEQAARMGQPFTYTRPDGSRITYERAL
jgi:hypothetical protein